MLAGQFVCRNWHPTCRNKRYRIVKIKGRQQFKRFLATFESSTGTRYPMGFGIIELYMPKRGFNQQEFEKLPALLPNLAVFDFPTKTRKHLKFGDYIKPWKKLRSVPNLWDCHKHIHSVINNFGPPPAKLKLEKWVTTQIYPQSDLFRLLSTVRTCSNSRSSLTILN